MVIPRIFHRTRLSDDTLPDDAARFAESWRRHHPAWEFRDWTMDNLPALRNRDLFDACANTGHRADILRYELLEQFGGIYVDLDFECRRPLDPLLANITAFAGTIAPRYRDLGVQTVETAILGSVPALPFISQVVTDLRAWLGWWGWHRSVAVRTGPQYFEKQLRRWHGTHGSLPLTLFKPDIFYPYQWDEPHCRNNPFPVAYGVHHWWGTWRKQALMPHPELP